MIELKNISKKFGKQQVLNSISTRFEEGECIALLGPNGCGKTTMIKSILGMVLPDEGEILFNNIPVKKGWQYRNEIGYMPQIGRYPENMTIAHLISMMKDIRKNSNKKPDDELIYTFGLDKMMGKKMRTLSGGTTQKVSAALAFMFKPQVLILDEPTAGLDPVSSLKLKEKIIKESERGKLILITSHILSELDDLVTKVAYMNEGKFLFELPLQELRTETGEQTLSRAIASVMKRQAAQYKQFQKETA
jgi:Cu-processing system ATP-binding protein